MERFADELKKIKENLGGVRDDEIRRKARFLIRILESNTRVRRACDSQGICPKTFYDWLNRVRRSAANLDGLKNKSRRPLRSPRRLDEKTADRLCALRSQLGDCGGRIVVHAYFQEKKTAVSHSAADKEFARRGIVLKRRVKPNKHRKRYASANPMDRVQFDTLWLGIEDAEGSRVYSTDAVDCNSRFAFARLADSHDSGSADLALREFISEYGRPKLVQTDNGSEFTCRYISELNPKRLKQPKVSLFESTLREHGIEHYLIKPRTPQHNGKVERFHRTMLRFVAARNLHGKTLAEIDAAAQEFVRWYNFQRPHSSQNYLPPAAAFFRTNPSQAA